MTLPYYCLNLDKVSRRRGHDSNPGVEVVNNAPTKDTYFGDLDRAVRDRFKTERSTCHIYDRTED